MRNLKILVGLLLVATCTLMTPVAAHAVTNSSADPTGDITNPVNDITNLAVSLDVNQVSVEVTTASALPALSDPSWKHGNTNGRSLLLMLSPNAQATATGLSGPTIKIDGDRQALYDSVLASEKRCEVSTSIVSTTLTATFPAGCLNHPGSVHVWAELGTLGNASDTDDAVQNGTTGPHTAVTASMGGGYWLLGSDGGIFSFGDAQFYGSTGGTRLNAPVVGMSARPDHLGYRIVASDGGVFSYGNALFYGSTGSIHLNKPVVGMATTPTGDGYWLVASDGGIFAYGDATFYGSTGSIHLNSPVVGMAPTASGHGYWLVAADGGIFAYGDAAFYGSMGGQKLNASVVGMSATATGNGYMLAAADGGVFAFGNARGLYAGSGNTDFSGERVVGVQLDVTGYRLLGAQGHVRAYGPTFNFGDSNDFAVNGSPVTKPFVGITNRP